MTNSKKIKTKIYLKRMLEKIKIKNLFYVQDTLLSIATTILDLGIRKIKQQKMN